MQKKILIRHYADAFMRYAGHTIGMARISEEIWNLKSIIERNPEFQNFLMSHRITLREKFECLDHVLGRDFAEEILHFIKFLLTKGRFEMLKDIFDRIRTAYVFGEQVEVLIKTAFPLDHEEIISIQRRLEEKARKRFKYYIEWDPNLLGGVQIMIGNRVLDASVKRRLEDLRKEMMRSAL